MAKDTNKLIADRNVKRRSRAAYFAVYDLQGGPISPKLQARLEAAILKEVENYPSIAITVKND